MSLRAYRLRLLLAMGVPALSSLAACHTAAPPPPPPNPTDTNEIAAIAVGYGQHAAIPVGEEAEALVPAAATCGMDTVREQVCGIADGGPPGASGCGISGTNLTSYGGKQMVRRHATYQAHDPAFKAFGYDAQRSDALRAQAAGSPTPTPGVMWCCYSHCTPLQVKEAVPHHPLPPASPESPPDYTAETWRQHWRNSQGGSRLQVEEVCMPAPEGGTSMPSDKDPACAKGVVIGGHPRPHINSVTPRPGDAGADPNARCCYAVPRLHPPEPQHTRGRPLRIAGVAHTASVAPQPHWVDETKWAEAGAATNAQPLTPQRAALLAAAWLREAQLEHASVAAFAKLSLQLMALGAPAALVDAALVAARDEVTHAQIAFSAAARFGGRKQGPAPFAEAGAGEAPDMLTLLRETLIDGCLGETVAGEEARRAAEQTHAGPLAEQVGTIAVDEMRHAELGWRIAAWVVREEGAAAVAIVREFAEELRCERVAAGERGAVKLQCCARETEAYGILCDHERANVRADVIDQVVLPCLDGLLEAR